MNSTGSLFYNILQPFRFSFGIPDLPLFQVVTAGKDHIVIPFRVPRWMDVGSNMHRFRWFKDSSTGEFGIFSKYQLVCLRRSAFVNQTVARKWSKEMAKKCKENLLFYRLAYQISDSCWIC